MDMFDEHTKQLTIFKKYVLGREDAVDEAGDMIRRAGGVIDLADKELLRAIRKGKHDHTDGWVQWEDTFWKDNAGESSRSRRTRTRKRRRRRWRCTRRRNRLRPLPCSPPPLQPPPHRRSCSDSSK